MRSRIKSFRIEFVDPDTMKLVTTKDGQIIVFMATDSELKALLIDDEVPFGMKQLLIKKVE